MTSKPVLRMQQKQTSINRTIPASTPTTIPAMAPPDKPPPVLVCAITVPLPVCAAVLAAGTNVCVVDTETETTAVTVVVPEVCRSGAEGEVVGAASPVEAVHFPGA
jgi:hypothetical protein